MNEFYYQPIVELRKSYKALHERFGMDPTIKSVTDRLNKEFYEWEDEDYCTVKWFEELADMVYLAVQLADLRKDELKIDEYKPTVSYTKLIRDNYTDYSVLLSVFVQHNATRYIYQCIAKNDAKTPETHILENGDILRRKVLVTPDEAFKGWVYSPYDSGVVAWEKDKTTIVLSADGLKVMNYVNSDYMLPVALLSEIHAIVTSPIMSKFMVLYNEGKNLKDGVLC